jgi:hypothetical protein
MRKSSVRGMFSLQKIIKAVQTKKPPSLAVFSRNSVGSFIALLLRHPAAFPPPLGWNS